MPDISSPAQPARFTETGKGTYILVLRLAAPSTLVIGKLGTFYFPAGWYTYVGSAFGAGGLSGRLKHHFSTVKKPHWHIDYLRQKATLEAVWYMSSETSSEHQWAAILCTLTGAAVAVPRFGASDCQCKTHLSYFPEMPDYDLFCALAGTVLQQYEQQPSTKGD